MPIYVYEREDGTTFEKLQKVSDDVLTTCPETGQKVSRKITPTAIHFKGSGFYQTDYKPNGKASSNGSAAKDADSSGDSSSSSSDSSSKASCDGSGPTGGCKACSSDSSTTSN